MRGLFGRRRTRHDGRRRTGRRGSFGTTLDPLWLVIGVLAVLIVVIYLLQRIG